MNLPLPLVVALAIFGTVLIVVCVMQYLRPQNRAKLERDVMREAVRTELGAMAAELLVERTGRAGAEAERKAVEEAARERIQAAFTTAHAEAAQVFGQALDALKSEQGARANAILEAARIEVGGMGAQLLVEWTGRAAAEAERKAVEEAARERIHTAFAMAYAEAAQVFGQALDALKSEIASVCIELQRDEQSGRELLWAYWRVMRDYCPGLAPPNPPKFAWAVSPPTAPPPVAPRPAPTTKPEPAARPPAPDDAAPSSHTMSVLPGSGAASGGRPCSPDAPPVRSAEDEARIAARLGVLLDEAAEQGHAAHHCGIGYHCTGDSACQCGCDPCGTWLRLRQQAERELMDASLQAAHLVRPPRENTIHRGASDASSTSEDRPQPRTKLSLTLVCPVGAVPTSRPAPQIDVEHKESPR